MSKLGGISRTLLLVALLAPSRVAADQLLKTITWETAPAGARLERDAKGTARLVVESQSNTGLTVSVLALDQPGITGSRYALVGEVRTAGVVGQGYLEMWSLFPDGGRYFSRTLAPQGPLAALSGTTDWRRFVLPFFLDEAPAKPSRIEVNLVLPAAGTVRLGPLELRQYERDEDPLAAGALGWLGRPGLLGSVLGVSLGLLGALVGVLAGTGRAPQLARTLARAGAQLGGGLLAGGLLALVLHQPTEIVYSLLLAGGIGLAVFGVAVRTLRQREQETELRRMRAIDTH